jgi:hypothetical protein
MLNIPSKFKKHVVRIKFDNYHWVDTSAGGLLVPEGILLPVVNISVLTWTHSWNNRYHVHSKTKCRKPYNYVLFGRITTKGLNKIAKMGQYHLCLREENRSFDNNSLNTSPLIVGSPTAK